VGVERSDRHCEQSEAIQSCNCWQHQITKGLYETLIGSSLKTITKLDCRASLAMTGFYFATFSDF
jgi:hypothetical protein